MSERSTIVHSLRCEYQTNPLSIDAARPRLSWQIAAARPNIRQAAYQVELWDDSRHLWDTGKVDSDQSIQVPYNGPLLTSRQRCTWRVRIWDETGTASEWSEAAWWEMGLLRPAGNGDKAGGGWQADWIEPEGEINPQKPQPCPYLRRQFDLPGRPRRARLYTTAHGCYSLYLNGQRVGDQVLAPGCTSYHKRLQYQVYDVTHLLTEGENALGATLGDGWWRGSLGVVSQRNTYGQKLALLAQLHLTFDDGTEQVLTSDKHWRTATGPIQRSDMKDGEVYDARLEMPGWNAPGFDDSGWQEITVVDYGYANLVAEVAPPIRRKEEFPGVTILTTPSGQKVIDFGQNLAGVVRFKVQGEAGTKITLQHGEALNEDGNFSLAHLQLPLPGATKLLQKVEYTCRGGGEEVYEPLFTFHGFRYAWVQGYPGELRADAFTAVAIYSDMPPSGEFECSNSKLNQLQRNILWSQKSNFLDIPTDCPQRERAGWTGDAQIFARTGSYNMESAGFFTKWLRDLAADQHADGLVPNLIPDPHAEPGNESFMITKTAGSAGWGDAAVIVPWTLYHCYADTRLLQEQYASMKAWVDYARSRASHTHWIRKLNPRRWFDTKKRDRQAYLWDTGYHWGEWLEPGGSLIGQFGGMLWRLLFSEPRVATAYLAHSSRLLAEVAEVLGEQQDAEGYRDYSAHVRDAYLAEYVKKNGRIKPDRQASYVRALAFDLVPDDLRPAVARRLVELIREADTHIGTGFLSTVFLCHVLSEEGYLDVAYELLNQDTIPSWLYAIGKGATTIWETWQGIKPDGSVEASLNHYSPGAVGGWLYQVVAGIDLMEPGYKRIRIQPWPGGGLSWARGSYQSLYGPIESAWRLDDGLFSLEVTIPPNTTAQVQLPDDSPATDIGSGSHSFQCQWPQKAE